MHCSQVFQNHVNGSTKVSMNELQQVTVQLLLQFKLDGWPCVKYMYSTVQKLLVANYVIASQIMEGSCSDVFEALRIVGPGPCACCGDSDGSPLCELKVYEYFSS